MCLCLNFFNWYYLIKCEMNMLCLIFLKKKKRSSGPWGLTFGSQLVLHGACTPTVGLISVCLGGTATRTTFISHKSRQTLVPIPPPHSGNVRYPFWTSKHLFVLNYLCLDGLLVPLIFTSQFWSSLMVCDHCVHHPSVAFLSLPALQAFDEILL